ncbi:sensor histidine kinase [Companilactobacillus kimchiensis]|uniref:sensor histidine kinase n=1 Tax=Companilactobacillus kimchiensis TaxID=993692 RepID=UPI0007105E49|nr:histidine kinase [Companilactobacillus kimchiensis]
MQFKKFLGFYLRMLILFIVIIELIVKNLSYQNKIIFISFTFLAAALDIWNYSPWLKKHSVQIIECSTYLIFIILGFINLMNPKTITIMYFYFMIVETAESTIRHTPRPKHIIIIQFIIYFAFVVLPTVTQLNFSTWVGYFELILSPFTIQFWSTYLISYLYLNLVEKNRAIDNLNKELMTKVDQLQDYSAKIKELTLIEERQRISQNLHDMLGHSLIGLRLHLDALNQFIDTDPQKSHQILDKSKSIIDHSLIELRESVNELNESKELADLKTALEELQSSISVTGKVKVDLKMYFDVNKLDISIKDLIYKTAQEFITNSLKHGHSSLIIIKLRLNDNQLIFNLSNNGLNATDITASNGINGIKDRVKKLQGTVEFTDNYPVGFKTDITLPIGVTNND